MVILDSDNAHSSMKVKMEHTTDGQPQHHLQLLLPPSTVPPQHASIRRDSVSLSDYYSDNEPNDMDFNEMAKISQYRQAIEMCMRRCEALSRDNEKLVRRLHHVKKTTKRKEKDVSLLKGRLDLYSDEWRTAQPETQFKGEMPTLIPAAVRVPRKYKVRKSKLEAAAKAEAEAQALTAGVGGDGGGNVPTCNDAAAPPMVKAEIPDKSEKASKKAARAEKAERLKVAKADKLKAEKGKRKRAKAEKEKDPNAPKRPANPFFQFCQEQRPIVMGELNSELMPGEPELSKQELTRQLASRWRSLDMANKQIYINMYVNSKQKYNEDMESYKRDNDAASAVAALMGGGKVTSTPSQRMHVD